MTRRFWPIGEGAQADYEALRQAAARFGRRGLAGLIAWPSVEPVWLASIQEAERAPWTPHADPRLDALAAGYGLILDHRVEHRNAGTEQG